MSAFTGQITKITGPMLLGTLINCGLHGILCVQVHTYYMAFPTDPIFIKIMVYGVFAFETTQALLVLVDGFDVFATHFGDVLSLDEIRLYWLSVPVIGSFVAAIGQLFFAYRLRVISGTWIFPITVTILSLWATVVTLMIAAHVYTAGKISAVFTIPFELALMSHLANILCDIEIAITMIYYLSRHNPILSSRLRHQIKRLIRLVLEAGILTTTANILTFLLYVIAKGTIYFIIPYGMIPKLYSNTLAFILNNRGTIVGGRHDAESGIDTISLWGTDTAPHLGVGRRSRLAGSNIAFREACSHEPNSGNSETAYTSTVASNAKSDLA